MDGRQHRADVRIGEHHRDIGFGVVRQHFRMPGKGDTCGCKGFFVDGGSDDPSKIAADGMINAGFDRRKSRFASPL